MPERAMHNEEAKREVLCRLVEINEMLCQYCREMAQIEG